MYGKRLVYGKRGGGGRGEEGGPPQKKTTIKRVWGGEKHVRFWIYECTFTAYV